jgi:hypothetical protein
VLEKAIVGVVNSEVGHRQQYCISATSYHFLFKYADTSTSLPVACALMYSEKEEFEWIETVGEKDFQA